MEVLEGSYGSTSSIKRLCGQNLPFENDYRTVRSEGSSLLVHMHTDNANENRGFAASHEGEYNLIFNIFNLLPWFLLTFVIPSAYIVWRLSGNVLLTCHCRYCY